MKKLLSSLLALALGLSLAVLPASALELDQARELLAVHYVDGVPPEVLELPSLDAILKAIDDPYTFYMTPEQYDAFNQSVNGQTVVGIGATVETAYNGGYRVMSVLPRKRASGPATSSRRRTAQPCPRRWTPASPCPVRRALL